MAIVLCEMCGETLEAEEKEHLLRVYDRHVAEKHGASPAQWTEFYNRNQAAKEKAKKTP